MSGNNFPGMLASGPGRMISRTGYEDSTSGSRKGGPTTRSGIKRKRSFIPLLIGFLLIFASAQNKSSAYPLIQLHFALDGIGVAAGYGEGDIFGLFGVSYLFNTVPGQYKPYESQSIFNGDEYIETYRTAGYDGFLKLGWRGFAKGTFLMAGFGTGYHDEIAIYKDENNNYFGAPSVTSDLFISFIIGGGVQLGDRILLEVTYNTYRGFAVGIGFILKE